MKAIAIDGFGGTDALRKRGLPRPEPRDDELRIRVVVAGVTTLDLAARRGALEGGPAAFPWVPGFEIAGTVDAMGPLCGRFRLGDRVWALLPHGGGYAEFAVTRESNVAPMPASLLFEEAACLPLDGAAVWSAQSDGPSLLDGSGTALILGAGTGAGHLAVQLALAAGSRVVVRAPQAHRELVGRLGSVEWADDQAPPGDLAAGLGASDRVFVDDAAMLAGFENRGGAVPIVDISGDGGSVQDANRSHDPAPALSALSTMVEQRRLRPQLFKIMNIGCAIDAHECLESGEVCGKLALTF